MQRETPLLSLCLEIIAPPTPNTATGEDPILRCPDAIELHGLVPVVDVAYLHNQLPSDDLRGTAKAPSIKFSGGGQRELE